MRPPTKGNPVLRNREFRIRVAKIDDSTTPTVAEDPIKILPTDDIREMMILGAICVGGVALSISAARVLETIAIHHATK